MALYYTAAEKSLLEIWVENIPSIYGFLYKLNTE